MHANIIADFQQCMSAAVYREDLFDICDNNGKNIWSNQLNERLLFLQKQSLKKRLVPTRKVGVSTDESVVEKILEGKLSKNSDAVSGALACVVSNDKKALQMGQKYETNGMRREISFLPSNLDELVTLWRYGSEKRGFRPAHQYDSTKTENSS